MKPGVVAAHLHHFTQSSSGSMDLPWKAHGMPWRPKSGFGHDPKNLSLPSILCSKGCHYQFLATEMDFGAWCLVCHFRHLPELEGGIQLGPLKQVLANLPEVFEYFQLLTTEHPGDRLALYYGRCLVQAPTGRTGAGSRSRSATRGYPSLRSGRRRNQRCRCLLLNLPIS